MSIDSKHSYRFGFLKSEEWKGVRLIALARRGAACAVCGKVDWSNDAHHRHYNRRWKDTKAGTLDILCRSHHDLIHLLMAMFPKSSSCEWIKLIKKERRDFTIVAMHMAKNPGSYLTSDEFLERQTSRDMLFAAAKKVRKLLTDIAVRA